MFAEHSECSGAVHTGRVSHHRIEGQHGRELPWCCVCGRLMQREPAQLPQRVSLYYTTLCVLPLSKVLIFLNDLFLHLTFIKQEVLHSVRLCFSEEHKTIVLHLISKYSICS